MYCSKRSAERAREMSEASTSGLSDIYPSMPVLNLEESVRFYEKMNFAVVNRFGQDMAILERDGRRVALWTCLDASMPLGHHYFVLVRDVSVLLQEFGE